MRMEDQHAGSLAYNHTVNEAAVSFDIYDGIGGYSGDVLIQHGNKDAIAAGYNTFITGMGISTVWATTLPRPAYRC